MMAFQPDIMPKAKNDSAQGSAGIKTSSPNNASVNLAVAARKIYEFGSEADFASDFSTCYSLPF